MSLRRENSVDADKRRGGDRGERLQTGERHLARIGRTRREAAGEDDSIDAPARTRSAGSAKEWCAGLVNVAEPLNEQQRRRVHREVEETAS